MRIFVVCLLSFFGLAAAPASCTPEPAPEVSPTTVRAGEFVRIYNPSVGETHNWYINDHTIVRGPDGLWHMFGITHEEPANPLNEVNFAHATAPTLTDRQWMKQPFALTADETQNEVLLWAPYVFFHEGLYYMYYVAGSPDHEAYRIHLATSPDLWSWTRHPENPMVVDGFDARDPFILRVGNQWALFYTANTTPQGGHHIVAYRLSDDLIHWGERHIALDYPETGTWGGPTESPFIVHKDGFYYLFNGPVGGYVGTAVYKSDTPFHFDVKNRVGLIPSHAAEVVRDLDGSWYITHAGWGQGGLYLAPLLW